MKYLFYDCGFNVGHYLELLLGLDPNANREGMGIPRDIQTRDNSDFKYYAFEANPEILKYPKETLNMENPGVDLTMNNKLVHVADGKTYAMAIRGGSGSGSTIYCQDAIKTGLHKIIQVESIDFARFLKSTAEESDRVIVKLDIEGSEYEVLNHLINTGAIYLIDDLICEFHKKATEALERSVYKTSYQYFKNEEYKKHLNSLTAWNLRHLCWAAGDEKRTSIKDTINYRK